MLVRQGGITKIQHQLSAVFLKGKYIKKIYTSELYPLSYFLTGGVHDNKFSVSSCQLELWLLFCYKRIDIMTIL